MTKTPKKQRTKDTYECWVEIGGFSELTQSARFGKVEFRRFDKEQIRRLKDTILTKHTVDQEQKIKHLDARSTQSYLGKSFGVVIVKACDASQAMSIGEKTVQETLYLINFFIEIVYGPRQWLYLSTRNAKTVGRFFVLVSDGSFNWRHSAGGPFSFKSSTIEHLLNMEGSIGDVVRLVDGWLKSPSTSKISKLLLRPVRWCGRAIEARNLEDAFLQYAIALECLYLPEGNRELTYRLSLRIAKLIGTQLDERKEYTKTVRDLYESRSRIVHGGTYQTTEDDCKLIGDIAKNSVIVLLSNPDISTLKNATELERWFQELELQ